MNIKYFIISHEDALRLGVTKFRQGSEKAGYLVHQGDMACATEDLMSRARQVSVTEAKEFIKSIH